LAKKVRIMLDDLLHKRGMSLNELSLRTGVRRAALSELNGHKRERIQLDHIEKIAEELGIEDIREIITIVEVEDEEQDGD
jgi:DNA-binding Xre family transcriptional regulator